MMNSVEKKRREKPWVCSCCGWNKVIFEFGETECGNPRCFHTDDTRKWRRYT